MCHHQDDWGLCCSFNSPPSIRKFPAMTQIGLDPLLWRKITFLYNNKKIKYLNAKPFWNFKECLFGRGSHLTENDCCPNSQHTVYSYGHSSITMFTDSDQTFGHSSRRSLLVLQRKTELEWQNFQEYLFGRGSHLTVASTFNTLYIFMVIHQSQCSW